MGTSTVSPASTRTPCSCRICRLHLLLNKFATLRGREHEEARQSHISSSGVPRPYDHALGVDEPINDTVCASDVGMPGEAVGRIHYSSTFNTERRRDAGRLCLHLRGGGGMSQVELMVRAAAKKTVDGVNRAIAPLVPFSVPPYGLMRRTGAKSLWHYWDGGIRSYLPIAVLAEHYGVDLRSAVAVLDFGCGVGRQLLHFTRDYPRPKYAACDVHPQYVEFVTRAYPYVSASVSAFNPPLTYADHQFDMLYSVSVFSHLHPDTHARWLKELSRVLKPGGYAFLTIEGATAVRGTMARKVWEENPDEAVAALERDGVRFSEYKDLAWQKTHEGAGFVGMKYGGVAGSYGNTAMTPAMCGSTGRGPGSTWLLWWRV